MIYPISVFGNPVLRKETKEIDANYEGLNELIENMFETMYKTSDGIGLAAPQIGLPIRLFVMDLDPFGDDIPELKGFKKAFINARITNFYGDKVSEEEGCLSLPGIHENVPRHNDIDITYYDENFVLHNESYSGWAARVIQHEYDHIEGKLFIDYISPIRRRLIKSKLEAIQKGKASVKYKIKL